MHVIYHIYGINPFTLRNNLLTKDTNSVVAANKNRTSPKSKATIYLLVGRLLC